MNAGRPAANMCILLHSKKQHDYFSCKCRGGNELRWRGVGRNQTRMHPNVLRLPPHVNRLLHLHMLDSVQVFILTVPQQSLSPSRARQGTRCVARLSQPIMSGVWEALTVSGNAPRECSLDIVICERVRRVLLVLRSSQTLRQHSIILQN